MEHTNNTPEEARQTARNVEDMRFHHAFVHILADIRCNDCSRYTMATLARFIEVWFGEDNRRAVIKSDFYTNAEKYLEYLTTVSDIDRLRNAHEIKQKTKEMLFDFVDDDTYNSVVRTLMYCGVTFADKEKVTPDLYVSFEGHHTESMITCAIRHLDPSKIAPIEVWRPAPDMFEINQSMPTVVNVVDDTPEPEPAPAPEPEPEPAPAAQQEPEAKFISDDTEIKEFIKEAGGTLLIPTKYRQVKSSELTPSSWTRFRKQHNLQGRWSIYIETNPEIKKQNKAFKYKVGHCAESTWDGVYEEGGFSLTDYPFGNIYIVRI